jgi:hypothetical protein
MKNTGEKCKQYFSRKSCRESAVYLRGIGLDERNIKVNLSIWTGVNWQAVLNTIMDLTLRKMVVNFLTR